MGSILVFLCMPLQEAIQKGKGRGSRLTCEQPPEHHPSRIRQMAALLGSRGSSLDRSRSLIGARHVPSSPSYKNVSLPNHPDFRTCPQPHTTPLSAHPLLCFPSLFPPQLAQIASHSAHRPKQTSCFLLCHFSLPDSQIQLLSASAPADPICYILPPCTTRISNSSSERRLILSLFLIANSLSSQQCSLRTITRQNALLRSPKFIPRPVIPRFLSPPLPCLLTSLPRPLQSLPSLRLIRPPAKPSV